MGDPAPPNAGSLAAQRIAANVASIESVPGELLSGVDREWVLAWACKGYDVYACRGENGEWYLWLATRFVELGMPPAPALSTPRRGIHRRH